MQDLEGPTTKKPGRMRIRLLLGIGAAVLLAVIASGAFFAGRHSAPEKSAHAAPSAQFDYSILNDVRNILGHDYVKPENLDDQTLFDAAVNGMLNVLNDYGTYYLPPEQFQIDTTLTGSFDGIGATVAQQANEIVIVSPIKGTPAERAGLKPGDVIVKVDGQDTTGWTVDQTVLKIRGPRGTQVTITLRHSDGKQEDFTLTRERVLVDSVNTTAPGGTLKDSAGDTVGDLGYIQIREFSSRTDQELDSAIKAQLANGSKGLIIDLRYNLGGLLDQTIRSADLLLDSGTILTQKDADGKQTVYQAKAGQDAPGVPVVILLNKYSASASEVLAAALHDNNRATTVGEKSFGKGTVNVTRQLANGGAMRVSIAQWLTPNGTAIDHVGITPDIQVTPTDADIDAKRDVQLFKAIDVAHDLMNKK